MIMHLLNWDFADIMVLLLNFIHSTMGSFGNCFPFLIESEIMASFKTTVFFCSSVNSFLQYVVCYYSKENFNLVVHYHYKGRPLNGERHSFSSNFHFLL